MYAVIAKKYKNFDCGLGSIKCLVDSGHTIIRITFYYCGGGAQVLRQESLNGVLRVSKW